MWISSFAKPGITGFESFIFLTGWLDVRPEFLACLASSTEEFPILQTGNWHLYTAVCVPYQSNYGVPNWMAATTKLVAYITRRSSISKRYDGYSYVRKYQIGYF